MQGPSMDLKEAVERAGGLTDVTLWTLRHDFGYKFCVRPSSPDFDLHLDHSVILQHVHRSGLSGAECSETQRKTS